MISQLKKILVAIAGLSKRDQRWIIDHLTPAEKSVFIQMQGPQRLEQASRFRHLSVKQQLLPSGLPIPPVEWETLRQQPTLFIAIVLEQGQYAWHQRFLEQFDKEGHIQNYLNNKVTRLKPLVKKTVFDEWTASFSFEACLRSHHG